MLNFKIAVELFMALVIGVAAGGLTFKAGKPLAAAVLAGGTAFGAAVVWLDQVIAA